MKQTFKVHLSMEEGRQKGVKVPTLWDADMPQPNSRPATCVVDDDGHMTIKTDR